MMLNNVLNRTKGIYRMQKRGLNHRPLQNIDLNLFKHNLYKNNMSCYLRHMAEVLKEADIKVTKENKKDIDTVLHSLVGVEYKNCSSTWKELKKMLQSNEGRKTIVQKLKEL